MFVAINNVDMDINDVEKWIKTARDANGGVISPEDAMEVLSKTNHLGHIKKVLRNIYKNCTTPEKMAPYKEFILSCVDRREMSGEAMDILLEMAKLCGCEDELETINKKPKLYNKTDCKLITVKSKEEFEALRGENLNVYFDADEVDLRKCDLSKVKVLKFREGAEVDFLIAENLPKDLDVSMCSKVNLDRCDLRGLNLKFREGAEVDLECARNMPEVLDLSMCSKVDLMGCDLSGVKEIKFREGAEVYLREVKNLPKDLDVSMCSKVDLFSCNLEGLNLKFREGAEVNFEWARNLPEVLDLSMCSKVILKFCDLSGVKEIKFREGADVDFDCAKNLPKDLDVSMCSKVELSNCNLEGLNLKFREGSEVILYGARNMPEVLDLSMCDDVKLLEHNLSGVKEIKFKDKEQEAKFMEKAEYFKGKIVYVGKENKVNTMPVNGGMEM